jgi:hypothetical protein
MNAAMAFAGHPMAQSWSRSDPVQQTGPISYRATGMIEGLPGREPVVKRSKFTEDQIAFALKQNELCTSVEEVCRKMGISDATFYVWKKKCSGIEPSCDDCASSRRRTAGSSRLSWT